MDNKPPFQAAPVDQIDLVIRYHVQTNTISAGTPVRWDILIGPISRIRSGGSRGFS